MHTGGGQQGKGATFWGCRRLQVNCAKCGVMIAESYLKQYMLIQHEICVPHTRGADEKGEGPTTYVLSFSRVLQSVRLPVPGCPLVCHSAGRLQEHLMFRHL